MNHDKTNLLFFKTDQSLATPQSLKLQNVTLHFSECTKYLGINIDETLRFKRHIEQLCVKLSQACYGLRVLRANTNTDIVKAFYFANFYSKLRYGIIFWGSTADADRVFLKQKWALRIMCGLKFRESCRGHFKKI